MGFWFQTTFYYINNLVPSLVPRGKVRMGGWLRGFRQNQTGAAHRATLSPALSRRTGEGQAARRSINFCLTTVIPAQAGIHF